jgi:hypothetical protein
LLLDTVDWLLEGVGRLVFSDGTQQFAENKTYPKIVCSPRMKEDDLEEFCKLHLARYEKYFNENHSAIDARDELPPIECFW